MVGTNNLDLHGFVLIVSEVKLQCFYKEIVCEKGD